MTDIIKAYNKRFKERSLSPHNYPAEWVIRTLLGKYPDLNYQRKFDSSSRVLDLGFGDGRNWLLLKNMGLNIYGVDISQEIIEYGYFQATKLGSNVNLKIGRNSNVPFPDEYFDVVLASNSFYYVDQNETFDAHLKELKRYSRKGATFVASLPEIKRNFLFKDAQYLENGLFRITNDIHNLRNGYTLRGFKSKSEIIDVFKNTLENISIGYVYSDYFDYEMSMYIVAGNTI